MAWQLERLKGAEGECGAVDARRVRGAIERLVRVERPRLERLWAYYRNTIRVGCVGEGVTSDRPYRQAQEWGLPVRITGVRRVGSEHVFGGEVDGSIQRKEVVIENDIGWRVETIVDYLFGKPVVIRSAAPDPERRAVIDRLVRAILAHNGGLVFLQQVALLGAVYGFVDVLVKLERGCVEAWRKGEGSAGVGMCGGKELGEPPVVRGDGGSASQARRLKGAQGEGGGEEEGSGAAPVTEGTPSAGSTDGEGGASIPSADGGPAETGASETHSEEALVQRLARMVRLEVVEPARAVPFLSGADYRVVEAYGQVYEIEKSEDRRQKTEGRGAKRWWERLWGNDAGFQREPGRVRVVELISASRWQRYEDETLVAEGVNALGEVPLVHIQNTAVPFEYSGASDVEGLIPLQDELNTRLSDRAHRITMQSFKMYLGKGVEGFTEMPVGPGRMWETDDPNADVVEFGGESDSPSETGHIADLREAMDKASGVSPIAAGAIKNRIGRLTSAAALRITLISLLAKTEKKRVTYGTGLQRMVALALAWLDKAGVFRTAPEERKVELHWPSPLPENVLEKLQEAEAKRRLGVPREVVLRELGY